MGDGGCGLSASSCRVPQPCGFPSLGRQVLRGRGPPFPSPPFPLPRDFPLPAGAGRAVTGVREVRGRVRVRLSASGSFPHRFGSPNEGQGWPLTPSPPLSPPDPPPAPARTKRRRGTHRVQALGRSLSRLAAFIVIPSAAELAVVRAQRGAGAGG